MATGGQGSGVDLVPLAAGDAECLWALMQAVDVRAHLFEDSPASREAVGAMIAESLDRSRTRCYWRIATKDAHCAGVVGLRAPSQASLALRAIGWRSLELVIAVDPQHRGRGLAAAAVDAVADLAKSDGMTFALVVSADEADERRHRLLQRSRFELLGRTAGAGNVRRIYERPL